MAGEVLADPVADVGVLEGSPLQAREVDLSGEPRAHEDAEAVAAAQLPLTLAGAAAGPEGGRAPRGVGLAGR